MKHAEHRNHGRKMNRCVIAGLLLLAAVATAAESDTTEAELRMLRASSARLAKENRELKAELVALKNELEAAKAELAKMQAKPKPATAPSDSINQAMIEKRLVVGMTIAQAITFMGTPELKCDEGERKEYRWERSEERERRSGSGFVREWVHAGYTTVSVRNGVITSIRY